MWASFLKFRLLVGDDTKRSFKTNYGYNLFFKLSSS